jgi:branched-chain amino acid transport system substrate-binding protein
MEAPYTGTYATLGEAVWQGANAGAAAINGSGGILGRKVVVDLVDDKGDPADGVPVVEREIALNHPVGVIGVLGNTIEAVQPIYDRYHIPFMSEAGNTNYDNSTDPYFFRTTPSDSQLGVAMAGAALKAGYTHCAFTFSTAGTVQSLATVVEHTFSKNGGKIVATVPLTPLQSSYSSEVETVLKAKPDCVFLQTEPGSAGAYFSDFSQLGAPASLPFIGSDITAGSDFIQAITPTFAHAHLVSAVGSSLPGPGQSVFTKYYRKLYHKQPLSGANFAYDGIISLALGIDEARTTSGPAVVKAIPKTSVPPGTVVTTYKEAYRLIKEGKRVNYRGASGPLEYNRYHNVYGPFDVVQAQLNGNVKTLYTLSAVQLQSVDRGHGLG